MGTIGTILLHETAGTAMLLLLGVGVPLRRFLVSPAARAIGLTQE